MTAPINSENREIEELRAENERLGKRNAMLYKQISDAYDATTYGASKGLTVMLEVLRDNREQRYLQEWDELENEAHEYCTELFDVKAQLSTAQAEIKRLREVIEKAPHGAFCHSLVSMQPCNCWKHQALEGGQ